MMLARWPSLAANTLLVVLSIISALLHIHKVAGNAVGWSNQTTFSGYAEYWLDGGGITANNAFRPALACNTNNSCISIFPEITVPDPSNSVVQLFYKLRYANGTWGEKSLALFENYAYAIDHPNGQVQPYVAPLSNSGWAVVFRTFAYIYRANGKCCTGGQSIYVAYIGQEDAENGLMFRGRSYGNAVIANSVAGGYKRYPAVAADPNGTVFAIWETNNAYLADGTNIGTDKDILTTSFSLATSDDPFGRVRENTSEYDLTEVTSVFAGATTDTIQDRNAVMSADPRTGRVLMGVTATIESGYADIMLSEIKQESNTCGWEDRLRLTNYDGKDSDLAIAWSPFSDTWMVVWNHQSVGIKWAKLQPNDENLLEMQETGYVDHLMFPTRQGDEKVMVVADPLMEGYWSVFYRYETPGTHLVRVAYRISTDDGQTWSLPYFADISEDYDNLDIELYRITASATSSGDYIIATVWRNSSDDDYGAYRVMNTTHEVVFGDHSDSEVAPHGFVVDESIDFACFSIELPSDGSVVNLTSYVLEMAPEQDQCIHMIAPNISGAQVHMSFEILLDLELDSSYRNDSSCPFDYLALREENKLNNTPFLGPHRRLCAKGAYEDIQSTGQEAYFFIVNDLRGLGDDEGKLPATLVAWATPIASNETESSDGEFGGGSILFETRYADSYQELQDALLDEDFVHGEIVVTAPTVYVTEELRIRAGTNISLVGQPREGERVQMEGWEFLRVELEATMWEMTNIHFQMNKTTFQGSHRYGGIILVLGRVWRISNCVFYKTTAGGSLGIRHGGGLTVEGQIDEVVDCVFQELTAALGGAAIVKTRGSIGLIDRCQFIDNRQSGLGTGNAGAIDVMGYIGTIKDSLFSGNHCGGGGGAISIEIGAEIRNIISTNFTDNSAEMSGGALDFKKTSVLPSLWTGSIFSGNSAAVGGGALHVVGAYAPSSEFSACDDSHACIFNSTFDLNTALYGGAIFYEESPNLDSYDFYDCSLANNTATQGSGGSVYLDGTVAALFSESFFYGNSASESGGAIASLAGAEVDLASCIFALNDASSQGGALYSGAGTVASLSGVSFYNNSAQLTCRETSGCEMTIAWSNRTRCSAIQIDVGTSTSQGAYQTAECSLNEAMQAAATDGCTKGVGGSIYIAAGVSAHIHACHFEGSNPLPQIASGSTFTSTTGDVLSFADEAGRYVYSESRFRLSETTFDGDATSFAPSTAVIGCPGTCSSDGTCYENEDGYSPSVKCVCTGVVDGDDGYEEGGCELRRVKSVRSQAAAKYSEDEYDADGYVDLTWTWNGDEPDYFGVYRTATRDEDDDTVDLALACTSADESPYVVEDCAFTLVPGIRGIRMGLREGEGSFFRVVAVMDGTSTNPSDAMSTASIVCKAGYERVRTEDDGDYECDQCARATYIEDISVGCVACPNELQTTVGVATSANDCVAPSGFYMMTDSSGSIDIVTCSSGLDCNSTGSTLETLKLLPGFWRASLTSSVIHECPYPKYCIGGKGISENSTIFESNLNGSRRALSVWSDALYCADGHTGPFCAVCIEGYSKGSDGMCTLCTESETRADQAILYSILAVACIIWPLVIGILFSSALSERDRSKPASGCCAGPRKLFRISRAGISQFMSHARGPISILIGFVQVITGFQRVFGQTYDFWSNWGKLTVVFSWLNVDSSKLPTRTGCAISNTHQTKVILATSIPLVLLAILFIAYAIVRCFVKAAKKKTSLASASWFLAIFLIFLVFPSVNTTIFQSFVCDQLEDGSRYLRFDYATNCDDMEMLLVIAKAMAVIYVPGTAILFSVMISMSHRPCVHGAAFLHELYYNEKIEGREKTFRQRFRRYYEVIELLRKLLLTSIVLLVADGTVGQIAFVIFVNFLCSTLQSHARPYVNPLDNIMASISHAMMFCILICLLSSTVVENLVALEAGVICIIFIVPLSAFIIIVFRISKRAHNRCNCCIRTKSLQNRKSNNDGKCADSEPDTPSDKSVAIDEDSQGDLPLIDNVKLDDSISEKEVSRPCGGEGYETVKAIPEEDETSARANSVIIKQTEDSTLITADKTISRHGLHPNLSFEFESSSRSGISLACTSNPPTPGSSSHSPGTSFSTSDMLEFRHGADHPDAEHLSSAEKKGETAEEEKLRPFTTAVDLQ